MSNEELVISNSFFETTETKETEGTTTKSGINFLISNQELGISNIFFCYSLLITNSSLSVVSVVSTLSTPHY